MSCPIQAAIEADRAVRVRNRLARQARLDKIREDALAMHEAYAREWARVYKLRMRHSGLEWESMDTATEHADRVVGRLSKEPV